MTAPNQTPLSPYALGRAAARSGQLQISVPDYSKSEETFGFVRGWIEWWAENRPQTGSEGSPAGRSAAALPESEGAPQSRPGGFLVNWSPSAQQWVASSVAFPSLSHLADDPADALRGIMKLQTEVALEKLAKADGEVEPKCEVCGLFDDFGRYDCGRPGCLK